MVVAALEGRLAVLDGVHRLDMGTLSVLKRQVKMPLKLIDVMLLIPVKLLS